MVGENGSDDAMDFHALEGMQCMWSAAKAARRAFGPFTGWKATPYGSAGYSKDLLVAALSRSDTPLGLTVKDGRTQDLVGSGATAKAGGKAHCLRD